MNLSQLEWIIGQWEGIQGSGIYHEEWEKISESEFRGKAYMIKKGEITNPEKLKLHCDNTDIFYTADVSHNPEPVTFRMSIQENSKFVFENPEHDFPKKIIYKRESYDQFIAIISDEKKSFEFKLNRNKS